MFLTSLTRYGRREQMKYEVKFPNHSIEKKFDKALSILPRTIQDKIIKAVEKLSNNPRPYGEKPFKKLKVPFQFYQFTAQYRVRIGNHRVLYDVDDKKKVVWILRLKKRSERSYKS
ncbi:hypothetical protein ES705_50559 [subsurface metagenome]